MKQRIKGLAFLPRARLAPAPKNWRTHDQRQRTMLRGLLSEIGVAGAVLVWCADDAARERLAGVTSQSGFDRWLKSYDGPLTLIDGHMRREEIAVCPVLVTDLDEEEARKALATFDPVGDVAGHDEKLLSDLLAEVSTRNAGVRDLLDELLGEQASAGPSLQATELDVSDLEGEFFVSVRGPVPLQPDAIQALVTSLEALPGCTVRVGIVG